MDCPSSSLLSSLAALTFHQTVCTFPLTASCPEITFTTTRSREAETRSPVMYLCHFQASSWVIIRSCVQGSTGIETQAPCLGVFSKAPPRALREGNARGFLHEVELRVQLLIGLEFSVSRRNALIDFIRILRKFKQLGLLEPWLVITHTIWTTQEDTVFISDRDRNGGRCSVV